MAIFDEEQILRYLQYVEKNEKTMTEEEVQKYKIILDQILQNPELEAFLDKKFGELISNFIIDNPNILENAQKQFIRDENGFILLDEQGYTEREHNGPGIFAIKWIMVGGMPVLVKGMDPENNPYTTLISEQIAREAGYDVATYYPALMEGKQVIVTPSFLKIEDVDGDSKEEEIISGKKIAYENMDLAEIPELITKYFTKKGASQEEMASLVEGYKSAMLYNIFINARDGHNGNWGVVKGVNSYRFTPIFDLEGGLSENSLNIRPMHIGDSWDDGAMLEYLLQDERMKKYAKRLLNVDMDKVYSDIERTKRVKIPEELKVANRRVIIDSKDKINIALDSLARTGKIANSEDDTGLR